MAASPPYKVFDAEGEYVASTKLAEHALVLCLSLGDRSTIRYRGHAKRDIVWTQGAEKISPAESYDACVDIIWDRISERFTGKRSLAVPGG